MAIAAGRVVFSGFPGSLERTLMSRWLARLLGVCALLCSQATPAAAVADAAFAPVYEGSHVVPVMRLPGLPAKVDWSAQFESDTSVVLTRYQWYLAEVTCLLDETGQVRDAFLTESIPSRNLSATTVDELRQKKWTAALTPGGPVPGRFAFRLKYILQQYSGSLGTIAGRLRRAADGGDAASQYILSRLLLANVDFRKSDLDGELLLQSAAAAGERRAMLERGLLTGEIKAGVDPAVTLAEQRQWQLKAAQAGSGAAQLLVALDSWAERTDQGYARARHWLELANKQSEPGSDKYLAALLVSHSKDAADWKKARKLADTASHGWRDRHDPDTWQILAAASSLNGDFKGAIEAQTKAIALAEKYDWIRSALDVRLAAYQASRPVTDEMVVIPIIAHVVLPAPPTPSSSQ
jgi:tetratricopeptide (TPR) repeat protein